VEELDACFVVRDHDGQQLTYVYFEDEPGRRFGGEAAHPRRRTSDGGHHRQAAGAIEKPQSEATALVGQWGHSMSALKATSAAMVRSIRARLRAGRGWPRRRLWFQPLYGRNPSVGDESVRDRFAEVLVAPIPKRQGSPQAGVAVAIQNALEFDLNNGATPVTPTHRLEVVRSEPVADRFGGDILPGEALLRSGNIVADMRDGGILEHDLGGCDFDQLIACGQAADFLLWSAADRIADRSTRTRGAPDYDRGRLGKLRTSAGLAWKTQPRST
jgi:hypothetical protein